MWITNDVNVDQSFMTTGGIRFECEKKQMPALKQGMASYLAELQIDARHVLQSNAPAHVYQITLISAPHDTDTLQLIDRKELGITTDVLALPAKDGERVIHTVSKKEILLALMQRGRTTLFKGKRCRIDALTSHIALRQNIVAWAQELEWRWPDGGPAEWNTEYWRRGTPIAGHALTAVLMDAFLEPSRYAVGCYTAIKLVMVQGMVDYYHRFEQDRAKLHRLQARLLHDGEPLQGIEPNAMWSFESDFDHSKLSYHGKLLDMQRGIPSNNFVPGDWTYVLNTDHHSARKIGYEGSNALYLGRNQFADFYNDHEHSMSLNSKLSEVYQWRFGVFSAQRDAQKMRALSHAQIKKLALPPTQGGLLFDYRVVPRID